MNKKSKSLGKPTQRTRHHTVDESIESRPSRLIAYLRVSTDGQGDTGQSLQSQREQCEHYAAAYKNVIIEFVEEVASATDMERPLLKKALQRIAGREADGLLIAKLDRLTRSIVDIGTLVRPKTGVLSEDRGQLHSVNEKVDTASPSGRLILHIIVLFAQWELEKIQERTREAMRSMRERGLFTGGHPPYGFSLVGGKLVDNEAEESLLQRVADFVTKPGVSLREIADILHREGFRSRRGGRFLPTQVNRLLVAAERRANRTVKRG